MSGLGRKAVLRLTARCGGGGGGRGGGPMPFQRNNMCSQIVQGKSWSVAQWLEQQFDRQYVACSIPVRHQKRGGPPIARVQNKIKIV